MPTRAVRPPRFSTIRHVSRFSREELPVSRSPSWFRLILLLALLPAADLFSGASAAPVQKSASAQTWRERATGAGNYIVVLKPAVAGVAARSVNAAVADEPGVDVTHTFTAALNGFSAELSADAVDQLKSDPRVETIVRDAKVHPFSQEIPAGAQRIGATSNATAKIDGVNQSVNADIAILDMGVGPNSDLNIVGGIDCTDNSDPNYPTYNDVGGHGTHVAGIAAAIDNTSGSVGVAPGANIYSVRVLGANDGNWSWVICGIDWVTNHASTIDVANMSLGEDLGSAYADLDTLIHNAIKASVAAGVTYVVAAGNAGSNAATTAPAKYPEVIAVSAFCDSDGKPGGLGPSLSACNDDGFANFSNYGSVVDISAPGVDTRSLAVGGGINVMSGTSFAAPHVAGAAALYIAQSGRVGPSAVRAALIAASEKGAIPGDPDGIDEGRVSVGSFTPGTVEMGHGSGPVGDGVTVKLSDFPANASASIRFDSTTVGTAATDASGAVWYKITVPEGVRGSHTVTAIAANASGASSFTITPKLTLISPDPSIYGQHVTFKGRGYYTGENVTLSMAGATPATLGTSTANSLGSISITVTAPAAIGGSYTATLKGSRGSTGSRGFTISPSIALSTSSAPPGASVKVSIRGFQSSESYTVSFRNASGATAICNSRATAATASSSCTGKIPAGARAGAGTIEARGAKGTFKSTGFTVLSPSTSGVGTVEMGHGSGPVGDGVTVKLSDFPANASASIRFDSTTVGTAATDASGAVWYKITVPEGVRGSHTVTAIAANASGASSFTITPKLTLISPDPSIYGQHVTFKGRGYYTGENVTLSMAGATPATLGTSTANSLGSISITVTAPAAIGGSYTATLNGDRGSAGSRTFTIAPSIAISASSAAPGSRMTISIRGFQSNEYFTASLRDGSGSTAICGSRATTVTASSSCTGAVPPGVSAEDATIEAIGANGTSVSIPFTVLAPQSAETATAAPSEESSATPTPSPAAPATTAPDESPTEPVIVESTATPIPTQTPTETATETATSTEIPTLEPTATDAPPETPPAG